MLGERCTAATLSAIQADALHEEQNNRSYPLINRSSG